MEKKHPHPPTVYLGLGVDSHKTRLTIPLQCTLSLWDTLQLCMWQYFWSPLLNKGVFTPLMSPFFIIWSANTSKLEMSKAKLLWLLNLKLNVQFHCLIYFNVGDNFPLHIFHETIKVFILKLFERLFLFFSPYVLALQRPEQLLASGRCSYWLLFSIVSLYLSEIHDIQ